MVSISNFMIMKILDKKLGFCDETDSTWINSGPCNPGVIGKRRCATRRPLSLTDCESFNP